MDDDESTEHYQGQLVIKKTKTRVTNDEGREVFRTVRLLEDGSRVVEERPAKKKKKKKASAIAQKSFEDTVVETEVDGDIEHQLIANVAEEGTEKPVSKKKKKKKKAKKKKSSARMEVPDVEAEVIAPEAALPLVSYDGSPPPQSGGFQQNPQQYYYPNGGQPVVGQPNAGQPQVMYQVPYNEDKARCCGCTCAVFWAICCFTTIAIGLILWFVVIRRLFWWRNLRGLLDDDDNYYGYNWYDDYY